MQFDDRRRTGRNRPARRASCAKSAPSGTAGAADIGTKRVELGSPCGHNAFLVERDTFTPVLAEFLRDNAGSTHSPQSVTTRDILSR